MHSTTELIRSENLLYILSTSLPKIMAQVTTQEFAMSMLDLDNDGRISRRDFEVLVSNLDKNGYISLTEYRLFFESFKHANPGEVEAAFKSIDTSGDGKIQRGEWINYAFEYFYTTKNDLGSQNLVGSRCGCCGCCCCCPCWCGGCRRW